MSCLYNINKLNLVRMTFQAKRNKNEKQKFYLVSNLIRFGISCDNKMNEIEE